MNNLSPSNLRFYPIATAVYLVAGGAAGYIDTDCSATVATYASRLWVIIVNVAAQQDVAARAHGETTDNRSPVIQAATLLTYCSAAGHIDLYREAANATYRIIGYLA